jgi:antitoxin (DNA-binding transcriptional repressor) of toxin-antitoxin stability system
MLQSHFVSLEEAQARLTQLLDAMLPGETLNITKDDHTIAKVVKQMPPSNEPRKPGSAAGKIIMSEDFNTPLEDFKDYMP